MNDDHVFENSNKQNSKIYSESNLEILNGNSIAWSTQRPKRDGGLRYRLTVGQRADRGLDSYPDDRRGTFVNLRSHYRLGGQDELRLQAAYIGGMTRVSQDVPPFMLLEGHQARVRQVNVVTTIVF